MTREEFIKNCSIIQKALKNCTEDDIDYLRYVANGGKIEKYDLSMKQLIYHMCSGLNIFELGRLKKAFNTLMRL